MTPPAPDERPLRGGVLRWLAPRSRRIRKALSGVDVVFDTRREARAEARRQDRAGQRKAAPTEPPNPGLP